MIDFIRLIYWNKTFIEHYILQEKNFPKLKTKIEHHTKKRIYPYTDSYHSLSVSVNKESVRIQNSLHKFYNAYLNKDTPNYMTHNYNDFSYSQLCKAVDLLLEKFPNLNTACITTLEVGLNIPINRPAEEIINHELIFDNLKPASRDTDFWGKGCYKQYERNKCITKVYDKAKHFGLKEFIIRIENKIICKKKLKKLGVRSIVDLKSKACLSNLFNHLLSRFDDLTIVDPIYERDLPEEVKAELNEYMLSNFWKEQSKSGNRTKKYRFKKRFEFLLKEHNLLQTKSELRNLLCKKFSELINL